MTSGMPHRARASAASAVFILAFVAIPVAIFLWFFHWQILVPTNALWLLQGDWGANVVGWNALRHDEWRWPLGSTRLLAWPTGTPVTFTDSNPLVAILLKPLAGLLPTPFQYVGPWLFACVLLQFGVGYLLLRAATEDRWLRLLGASLLALTPTLMNRLGHANLCAHWTILLSLHLFLNVERDGRRDLGFAGVLLLSALIHPYFLLMNAAIWGSDVLRRGWSGLRTRALRELLILAARAAAVAAAPITALWATGALGGFEGEAEGFGRYSMSLDALINPGTPGYSRFLPVAPQGEAQVFEGFQYLGAGLLALVVVAALLVVISARARDRLRPFGRLAWLGPALFVLLALALSDTIQLHGRQVGDVNYDWLPFNLTSTFRASGRLFWPCLYVLLLTALLVALRLPRRWAVALCTGALLLQVLDLPGFAAAIRGFTADAARPQPWLRTSSQKWDPLIASASVIELQPPDPFVDGRMFYEIAWRATSLKRPVNVMYTARQNPAQKTAQAEMRARFLKGELDPSHLYIVTDGCLPAGLDPARVKRVNQLVVIPPATATYPFEMRPGPAPEPFPLGREVTLALDTPQFRCMLARDWSKAEGWGVWSDGPAPELVLSLAAPPPGDLLLTVVAQPHPERQGVSVLVGGRQVARWDLSGEAGAYTARIPRGLVSGPALAVVLKPDRPLSPKELGLSPDTRRLGVGLKSVRLDLAA